MQYRVSQDSFILAQNSLRQVCFSIDTRASTDIYANGYPLALLITAYRKAESFCRSAKRRCGRRLRADKAPREAQVQELPMVLREYISGIADAVGLLLPRRREKCRDANVFGHYGQANWRERWN